MRALVVILSVSIVLLVVLRVACGPDGLDTTIGVVLNALVAALGFWAICASIQTDREIKRYEYVEDYNFQFLSNPEFIQVERLLESCNQEYERIDEECGGEWGQEQQGAFMVFCDAVFGSLEYDLSADPDSPMTRRGPDGCISEGYQRIVNYLVYLESFVPLVNHGQVNLGEVDDLFGYRYFIAVNNPVLQANELCRERKYYRGIFDAYGRWSEYRDGDVPMSFFGLVEAWNAYKLSHPGAQK